MEEKERKLIEDIKKEYENMYICKMYNHTSNVSTFVTPTVFKTDKGDILECQGKNGKIEVEGRFPIGTVKKLKPSFKEIS